MECNFRIYLFYERRGIPSQPELEVDFKNQQQLYLTKGLKICDDIDPDKHFYHQYNNFGNKYYLEDDSNKLLAEKNIVTNFSLLHVNSRSLLKNLDHLINYLSIISHRFSVIAVSETWGNVNNEMFLNSSGYIVYL